MTTWEEALTNCHKAYLEKGGNSNAKVKNAHMWIKKKLGDVLGNDYTIFSLDNEKSKSKEIPIEGSLYTKKVDVAILKEQSPKGVVSFKYVASNYSQNTNNYFENLIGECYNIQSMGIPFCHVLVMRNNMPYFEDSSNVKNNETITSVKINKYLELLNQDNSACPKKISINIINITGDTYGSSIIHPKKYSNLDSNEKNQIKNSIRVSLCIPDDCDSIRTKLEELEINRVLEEFADIIKNI